MFSFSKEEMEFLLGVVSAKKDEAREIDCLDLASEEFFKLGNLEWKLEVELESIEGGLSYGG